jgi:23S rRNA (adenine2030-N6)-methyltransferase
MNYRHSFHAGNFADVHKHAVLAWIVRYLTEKPAAFRVLDTHAGAGLYDLAGEDAERTGEWRGGIGRLTAGSVPPAAERALAPYREALASCGAAAGAAVYPGSPLIALALMRPQDRLVACELEPAAAAALSGHLARDVRAKAVAIDGWTALAAYIPPKERRGVVLIDPPYEAADEFERLTARLATACRKWPTGIFLAWYPIKDRKGPDRLAQGLRAEGVPKLLRSELSVRRPGGEALSGSGLLLVNPPWRLDAELALLGPALASLLAPDGRGFSRLDWLSPPA